jgi:hypothetical protein
MTRTHQLTRRDVLKGVGTALALPLLEAMPSAAAVGAPVAGAPPVRLLYAYIPNGAKMDDWTPTGTGTDFELSKTLEPLAPFKQDLLVLSGLDLDKARTRYKGKDDSPHGRASGSFLTASIPVRDKVYVSISADQLAAQTYGKQTKFPSLELGTEVSQETGEECRGYPCSYITTLSWRNHTSPVPVEINPRLVFERLFSNGRSREEAASRALRDQRRKSILDLVAADARDLKARLGATDQRKLDEYFSSIRELETRLDRFEQPEANPRLEVADESGHRHEHDETVRNLGDRVGQFGEASVRRKAQGHDFSVMYSDFESHFKILADLIVLAFQTDSTRIATLMFGQEACQRPYTMLGLKGAWHDYSHHANKAEKLNNLQKINHYNTTLFAYLLEKMKSVQENGSTLLDNSMVVYGGGISNSDQHFNDNLPIVLAGRGGGTIKPGRHLLFPFQHIPHAEVLQPGYKSPNVPIANLHLALLQRLGLEVESFGDSTGALDLS